MAQSMDEAVDFVATEVANRQGCKATELAAILGRHAAITDDDRDWPAVVDEAIKRGLIVEVEYTLPIMQYRAKSFLLPSGTKVSIK